MRSDVSLERVVFMSVEMGLHNAEECDLLLFCVLKSGRIVDGHAVEERYGFFDAKTFHNSIV